MLLYNIFIDGESPTSKRALMDSLYIGGSTLASNVLVETFVPAASTVFGSNTTSLTQYVVEPVMSSIIYGYLYNNFFRQQFNTVTNRNGNMNMFISAAIDLITQYFQPTLTALFTGAKSS